MMTWSKYSENSYLQWEFWAKATYWLLSFPQLSCTELLSGALKIVQRTNLDYVLTIQHVAEYYDMKMVTSGVNDGEDQIVAFPVFVPDHTRVHDPI